MKYSAVMCPDGLFAHVSGPFAGRKHDMQMYRESGLPDCIRRHAFVDGQQYHVIADQGYTLDGFIVTAFPRGREMTPLQQEFNARLTRARISVEWGFGYIANYWKVLELKNKQKVLLSALGKEYLVCALLENLRTCVEEGNNCSRAFELRPPALAEYLA